MFQIKSFLGILASMVNRLRVVSNVLTDFNVGSNVRVLLESCAQEIDELYIQMVATVKAAIAQAVFTSFNFPPLPAVSATTTLTVTCAATTTSSTIPAGTVFTPETSTSGVIYTSTVAVNLPALAGGGDDVVSVPVVASVAGSIGNLTAGTQFTASPSPIGFISAVNQSAIVSGQDQESYASQYGRFQTYITSLARSTVAGIGYGAGSVYLTDSFGNVTERVAAVQVYEPYDTDTTQPPWLFKVWVYNGVPTGPGASSNLLGAVSATVLGSYTSAGVPVPGYKAAGTHVQINAATLLAPALTGTVYLSSQTSQAAALAAVEAAWGTYYASLPLAGGLVLSELIAAAVGVAGVVDFQFAAGTANVAGVPGQQIVPPASFSLTASGGTTP